MGTGYTRNDTTNNIADGNVINASDLDGEFDAVQAAFNGTTGHSHDGTTGEGPQIDTAGIAADAIDGTKIADDSINSEHYVDGSIDTAHIGNLQVTTAKIAADAIDGTKLADNAVDSEHYTDGSIDRVHLAADIVDGTKIADDSIDSEHYVDGSIDTAHIANDAVTGDKLANNIQIAGTLGVTGETTLTTHLNMGDNDIIKLGDSADLQIYHDGSDSYVKDAGTGDLYLQGSNNVQIESAAGANMIYATAGAQVRLFYNGSPKFDTTNTGIDVTGVITTDGMTTSADINFGDNDKAVFGAGGDLEIYHDGTNSYISDVGTGNLLIKTSDRFDVQSATGELMIRADANSNVKLNYDNATKLTTKSDGVDITGELQSDSLDVDGNADISGSLTMGGNIDLQDNDKILLGTSDDLQIYHDGSNSYIHDYGTGSLYIDATQLNFRNGAQTATYADFTNGGGARLMHNGNVKFETVGGGVQVTGYVQADSLYLGDDERAYFGVGNDLQIYHDGSNSYIDDTGTGNLRIRGNDGVYIQKYTGEPMVYAVADGAVTLYYDNAAKLATTSIGIDVTGRVVADSIQVQDNDKIIVGASGDLEIYHDGSNSYIKDTGTGSLNILASSQLKLANAANTEVYAKFNENGNVELRYNDSVKFETTSYGASITGSVVASTQTTSKSGSPAPNFDTYQNFVWTLTGNITLLNATTEKTGQTGFFIFIHSGAGRTVSLGTDYETAGGAGLTLSGTSGAVDIVPYAVQSSGNILFGTPQLAFS